MSFPKPHKTTLKNGLRILVVPMKETATVTVQVLVNAGSYFENKENNGVSHFLEHLCFKGTEKRKNATVIAHEFASIGAQNNAFTGEEVTGYWAKARTKHFEHILDIVSDLYKNPIIPAKEVEKEKGVVIEEINMYEDNPRAVVTDLFVSLLYGDQPAGRTVLGTKKNIRKMTREDIVSYRERQYVTSKTVVVIAGGIGIREAVKAVREAFDDLPRTRASKRQKVVEKQRSPKIAVKKRVTEQSHFLMGFRSYPELDKRDTATSVLSAVLGRGMSSRLFERLREEMGVCYYVASKNLTSTDAGVFAIRAGVDNKRLEEVVGVIMNEIRRLRDELVSPKELKKTKEVALGSIAMGLESSEALADWYGIDEVCGKPIETPEEVMRKIRAITPKELQKIARDIFTNDRLNLAVVGPVQNTARLKKILKV